MINSPEEKTREAQGDVGDVGNGVDVAERAKIETEEIKFLSQRIAMKERVK